MKNLILIRHAKSSWDNPLSDKERPIIQRGILDANLVATALIDGIPNNYIIQCSTAKRARETASIFAKKMLYPVESILFREELYTFDENKLEKAIQSIDNTIENCILFGHNEAITNFVNKFGTTLIENVPTSGLVWLQFKSENWDKINPGKTIKTIFPKNLK